MNHQSLFADVLDAAESLDTAAQVQLVAILKRRLAERGRDRVTATVNAARSEFSAGQCEPMSPGEIVSEALQ